jgi:predicted adenine nucleotide alpha hydrolase (AANH) superfamily ATPase
VRRIYADLQNNGVRCWFAEEDLKIGDHYHQRIDEAIRLYDKLIIVLSEAAVCSSWVEREVVAAREKEERQRCEALFPIRLDEAVMQTDQAWAANVRRRWHIGDFTRWNDHDHYQQAFERLLRDLKAQE